MPSPKTKRRQARRRERNRPQRTSARSRAGSAEAAIANDPEAPATAEALRAATAALDRAAAQGVIHRNAASRRKSRLQKSLNKANKAETS